MLLLFSSLFLYCFITFFYFYFWCTPRPLELDPPTFLNKMLKNRGKYFCIAMKLCIAKKNVFLMAHHCYIATLPKVSTRLEHFHLIISLFNLHFTLYIYSFLLLSELGLHFISFIHRFQRERLRVTWEAPNRVSKEWSIRMRGSSSFFGNRRKNTLNLDSCAWR